MRARGLTASVHDERTARLRAGGVHLVHRRRIRGEALDVAVQLHALEPGGERLGEDVRRALLTRQHRGQPHHARLRADHLGHVLVEVARHARLVGVRQRHHPAHPARQEEGHHLGRVQLVADGPAVLLEPAPDGLGDGIREEVDVGIHHGRQALG